ncbi:hypothetical protein KM043_012671 [Ampulex compressa]|nr:hypothetical protein KM043_012671 [Ampulex compressa]
MEARNKKLKKTLETMNKRVLYLTDGHGALRSQAVTLAESKLALENSVDRLRGKVRESRDACTETGQGFQVLLTELRRENDLARAEYLGKIGELQKEVEELRVGQDQEEPKADEVNQGGSVLMPGDDPELDMTRQLISNRERIEALSRQNERLSRTLKRLREYRLTTEASANK